MMFFLGTHQPHWLADDRFAEVPLFVSRRRLEHVRKLPEAKGSWALDSGGFTELQIYGEWQVTPQVYVQRVRRFRDWVGNLEWAAPQDWMCEPLVISGGVGSGGVRFKGTKLSVKEHQRLTVENYLELRSLAPDLPFVPVLQGWTMTDYWRCEDLYARAGVKLRTMPLVGIGTMCRRQATDEACRILATMAGTGIRLHGFGFKLQGLSTGAKFLASSDSMAWSYGARREKPLPGHDRPGPGRRIGHVNCANCADYALQWRDRVMVMVNKAKTQ